MKIDEAAITMPCGADWRTMKPLGTSRLCEACDRVVHDLSALREADARALLRRREHERLCIRYLHDSEGHVWFAEDARERLFPASRLARGGWARAARATAAAMAPFLIEACGGANPYYGGPDLVATDGGLAAPGTTLANPQIGQAADAGAETSDAAIRASDAASASDLVDAGPGQNDAGTDAANAHGVAPGGGPSGDDPADAALDGATEASAAEDSSS